MGPHGEVPYPIAGDIKLYEDFLFFDPKYISTLRDAEFDFARMLKGMVYDVKPHVRISKSADFTNGFTPFTPQVGMHLTEEGLVEGDGVFERIPYGDGTLERFPEAPYALFARAQTPSHRLAREALVDNGFLNLHLQIFFPDGMGAFESARAMFNNAGLKINYTGQNLYGFGFYPIETGPISGKGTRDGGLPLLVPADLEKLLEIRARFVKHAPYPVLQLP